MKKILIVGAIMFFFAASTLAAEPTVLLNEIAWMGTAASANDEWLELYNPTSQEIDLTGFRLEAEDGSPKIILAGKIPAGGYFLLERTDDETAPDIAADQIYTGSLSNTGEWLKLYDSQNNLIDQANAETGWPAGDNDAKKTMERAGAGAWQTSQEIGGTPKAENSKTENPPPTDQEPPTEPLTEPPATNNQPPTSIGQPAASREDIIINEIFPNPSGSDWEQEFIEIKNVSRTNIDLTSWKIANSAKQNFILPSLIMMPQSLTVFYRPQTNLALNNAKDKITLSAKDGKIIDQIDYKSAPENQSWQKNDADKFDWGKISPNRDNLLKTEILPAAQIIGPKEAKTGEIIAFDASDSFDPQNRPLQFFWDFGDGGQSQGVVARKIYPSAGNYEIALKAVAGPQASSTEKLKIKITGPKTEDSAAKILSKTEEKKVPAKTEIKPPAAALSAALAENDEKELAYLIISEFLPNPDTKNNQEEFIEILSRENRPVDLGGFALDDAEGGSRPFLIPAGTMIKPGQYLAFAKTQTKLALNDGGDSVRLLSPGNIIIDQAVYEKTKKGQGFALTEDFVWQQTETLTPGKPNALLEAEKEITEEVKTENATTTTGKILGAEVVRPIQAAKTQNPDPPQGQPTGKIRYLVSAIFTAVALGIGAVVKLKRPS